MYKTSNLQHIGIPKKKSMFFSPKGNNQRKKMPHIYRALNSIVEEVCCNSCTLCVKPVCVCVHGSATIPSAQQVTHM